MPLPTDPYVSADTLLTALPAVPLAVRSALGGPSAGPVIVTANPISGGVAGAIFAGIFLAGIVLVGALVLLTRRTPGKRAEVATVTGITRTQDETRHKAA